MAMAKIGTLMKFEEKDAQGNPTGNTWLSLGLGNKNSNPQYATTTEIIVRDGHGKVIARQTEGFVNLTDPRKAPDIMLKAGKISEEQAEKMKQRNIPDKIRYELFITK